MTNAPGCVPSLLVHTTNSTLIHAPRQLVFDTAGDLELWPRILPHYRYIQFLESGSDKNVVKMAATRSGIPVSWVSEQWNDPETYRIHFKHLRAWTKGMEVVWVLEETPAGTLVKIEHELHFRFPPLAPLAEPVISGFFIEHIANKTLACMKSHIEQLARETGEGS